MDILLRDILVQRQGESDYLVIQVEWNRMDTPGAL